MTATATMSQPQSEEHFQRLNDARRQLLEQRVILVAPTLGAWQALYQLPRDTDVQIDGKRLDTKNVTTPRVKMLTDTYPVDEDGMAWKKRIQQLDSRKSALVESMTVPYPLNGVRILPKSRGAEFFRLLFGETLGGLKRKIDKLRAEAAEATTDMLRDMKTRQADLRQERYDAELAADPDMVSTDAIFDPTREEQSIHYELRKLANEFVAQYDTGDNSIRKQIERNNEAYAVVAHKLPNTPQLLRSKFYLSCVPVEISSGSATTVTNQEIDEHADVVRAAVHQHVQSAIEVMISGPREELASALVNVRQLVERDGRVTTRTFNAVRTAIAKVRAFDFVANDELMSQINNLDQLIQTTVPSTLTSVSAANSGFTAALNSYIQEVESETRQAEDMERFGRTHLRGIDLDD